MRSEWLYWIELRIRPNEFEILVWVYNDELEFRMMKRELETVLENSLKKTMYK